MRQQPVIAAVMAGGRGERLGEPKATAQLAGRPLIDYPLEALAEAGLEAVVVAKRSTPLPDLSVPVWHEREEPAHPALGIATALQRAPADAVVVVGCDMPFLTAELLAYLGSLSDPVVVPSADGFLHPLAGRYARVYAPSFASALGKGMSLQELVPELHPRTLEEEELRRFGDPERLLFNVNTPADLARAEELLAG